MTPMLRNGQPTIKTRLLAALRTGDVLLPDPFAAGLNDAAISVATQFGCAPSTAKRYLQEYRTRMKRQRTRRCTNYENPERQFLCRLLLEAAEEGDWEYLESEEAANLLNLLFPFDAGTALAGLRANGF